jgi:predicted enzyme related to lactoylglutathione lyase
VARVVHFELVADEPERAARFWRDAFGWHAERWEGGSQEYWLLRSGEEDGIDGGIFRRSDFPVPATTICTLDVPDADAAVAAVESAGGSVVMPRLAVPGVGWVAYCRDTEGSVFGLLQRDESAAG